MKDRPADLGGPGMSIGAAVLRKEGRSNKEVATKLGISLKTQKTIGPIS